MAGAGAGVLVAGEGWFPPVRVRNRIENDSRFRKDMVTWEGSLGVITIRCLGSSGKTKFS